MSNLVLRGIRFVQLVSAFVTPQNVIIAAKCVTPQNVIIAAKCVMPQNVILTQNVIRIAAKCNTNAKCNNIDAKCNKIFNTECNNLSTQIVITFLTHNVITQNVIISGDYYILRRNSPQSRRARLI